MQFLFRTLLTPLGIRTAWIKKIHTQTHAICNHHIYLVNHPSQIFTTGMASGQSQVHKKTKPVQTLGLHHNTIQSNSTCFKIKNSKELGYFSEFDNWLKDNKVFSKSAAVSNFSHIARTEQPLGERLKHHVSAPVSVIYKGDRVV